MGNVIGEEFKGSGSKVAGSSDSPSEVGGKKLVLSDSTVNGLTEVFGVENSIRGKSGKARQARQSSFLK